MLTPYRDIELVHAVQKPLMVPKLVPESLGCELSQTFVVPHFTVSLCRKSTARVDLLAQWNEPVDDPNDKANGGHPYKRVRHDHAFEIKIPLEVPYESLSVNKIQHELGSTGYRKINYSLEATTRFREYLKKEIRDQAKKDSSIIKQTSVPVTLPALNRTRPATPRVLYVVPTFGWEKDNQKSVRKGGGLRVYLDRPWFSSGFGEMLAVVLPSSGTTSIDERLKPYITQWGNDPIWASSYVQGIAPSKSRFTLRKEKGYIDEDVLLETTVGRVRRRLPGMHLISEFTCSGLSLPDVDIKDKYGKQVAFEVAPHEVSYDRDRGLWYCDIEISFNQESYYPFIRLALARYQPNSLNNCHLSSVVLTDIAQLAPDRMVSVSREGSTKRAVSVTGKVHEGSLIDASKKGYWDPVTQQPIPPQVCKFCITNTVEVIVEHAVKPTNGKVDSINWSKVPNAEIRCDPTYLKQLSEHFITDFITQCADISSELLWSGAITIPGNLSATHLYRIVIKEYEWLEDDEDQAFKSRVIPGFPTTTQDWYEYQYKLEALQERYLNFGKRLVYVDTIAW